HPGAYHHLLLLHLAAGLGGAGLLVRGAVPERSGHGDRGVTRDGRRRCCGVGACRRIRFGSAADQDLAQADAAVAGSVPVNPVHHRDTETQRKTKPFTTKDTKVHEGIMMKDFSVGSVSRGEKAFTTGLRSGECGSHPPKSQRAW